MLPSIASARCLFVIAAAAIGCGDAASPHPADWIPAAPEETARAAELLRAADLTDVDARTVGGVPLQAVTGLAAAPRGLVVGGVSPADDRFWDAWFVPGDGDPPRRLAPVDNLVGVDAGGAVWTTIVSEDESGHAAYEVRLSPADGSPAVLLSSDLPPSFAADRVVAGGDGGRLLIGSEQRADGVRAVSVFAVAADRGAWPIARDPGPESALVVGATATPEALYLDVLYAADRPSTIVKVPLP